MKPNVLSAPGLPRQQVQPWRSRVIGAVALVIGAALVSRVVDAIREFGHYIPQDRLEFDYTVGLLLALVIGATIPLWPVAREDKLPLLKLWGAKVAVTLGFMLLYEWNYGLDAYGYYFRSQMRVMPVEMSFGSGTANMTAITWLIARLLPDSYHGLKVVFSLIGFVGLYLFYLAANRFLGRRDVRILYLVVLFPSCLFWSSILGKDPLQLLGVALYVYGLVSWSRDRRMRHLVVMAAGLLFSMFIRIWTGPILLFPLVAFAMKAAGTMFNRLVTGAVLLVLCALVAAPVAQKFSVDSAQDVVETVEVFSRSGGWAGGSDVRAPVALNGAASLISYAPTAMLTALFRPLPGELRNAFGTLAGLENGVIIVLVIGAFFRRRRARFADPVVWWSILFILGWSLAYGLSVFNLGSLVRFKLQILPVMLLLLLYLNGVGTRDDIEPARA